MLALAECKHALARPDMQGLDEVALRALGPHGRAAADAFVLIVQTGCCCCYVGLIAGNLAEATGAPSQGLTTLAVAPLFALVALVRFVEQLRFANRLGTAAMAVAVASGSFCGACRLVNLGVAGLAAGAWPQRPVQDVLLLASSVFFSFEGLGLVLPVEQEMARPTCFPKVVVLASAALTAAYLSVSVTCGIAFRGELETASLIAFLAARTSGAERAVLEVSNGLVTLAVFLTYPLQLLPVSDILTRWLGPSPRRPSLVVATTAVSSCADGAATLESVACAVERGPAAIAALLTQAMPWWAVQRLAIVAVCVAVSLTVGNVALLVSLFGAVGQTGLGMLAPLCHLALMRAGALPRSAVRAAVDLLIVAFCLVVMVSGTYLALLDIVADFQWDGPAAAAGA